MVFAGLKNGVCGVNKMVFVGLKKFPLNTLNLTRDGPSSETVHPSVHIFVVDTSIYKYYPVSTKLGQNVYDHKISDDFDYGYNWTKAVGVMCP